MNKTELEVLSYLRERLKNNDIGALDSLKEERLQALTFAINELSKIEELKKELHIQEQNCLSIQMQYDKLISKETQSFINKQVSKPLLQKYHEAKTPHDKANCLVSNSPKVPVIKWPEKK